MARIIPASYKRLAALPEKGRKKSREKPAFFTAMIFLPTTY
ncbi:hypothetical protein [Collimonas sp. PA-H2]|nr:hypothetical protein [Collimonas sp. PA-H2]